MEDDQVLIVAGPDSLRHALVQLTAAYGSVVAAASVAEAKTALERLSRVDVAIIDAELPDGNGLELARTLRWRSGETSLLIFTASRRPEVIADTQRLSAYYLRIGASPDNIHIFMRSRRPRLVREVVTLFGRAHGFTDREMHVLHLVLLGNPRTRVARKLGVSVNTVNTHLRRARTKYGDDHTSALLDELEYLVELARRSLIR